MSERLLINARRVRLGETGCVALHPGRLPNARIILSPAIFQMV